MAIALSFPTSDDVEAVSWRARILTAIRRPSASKHVVQARRAAFELVGAEIDRARRYERPVSLLCVPVVHPDALDRVRASIRETDHVAAGPDGVFVVLPETDGEAMKICADRLATRLELPASSIGAVSFPDDALTAGHLWELLHDCMCPTAARGQQPAAVEDAA